MKNNEDTQKVRRRGQFLSKDELGGQVDERINQNGRPTTESKRMSRREIKEKELLMLARKLKPHMADSIATAAKIMKNNEATHMNQLKAATILLNAYRELINDIYNGKDIDEETDSVPEQVQESSGPIFSLKVVGADE